MIVHLSFFHLALAFAFGFCSLVYVHVYVRSLNNISIDSKPGLYVRTDHASLHSGGGGARKANPARAICNLQPRFAGRTGRSGITFFGTPVFTTPIANVTIGQF